MVNMFCFGFVSAVAARWCYCLDLSFMLVKMFVWTLQQGDCFVMLKVYNPVLVYLASPVATMATASTV